MWPRWLRTLCFTALVGTLTSNAARAQGLPPLRKDKATLTILGGVSADRTLRLSDEVRVRVEVVGRSPLVVRAEDGGGDAHWAIEGVKPTQTVTDPVKGEETWRREFVCVPLQPGEHPLPVPGLSYTEGDDEQRHHIDWQQAPPVLRVLTQIGDPDVKAARDITDIEEPPPLPPAASPWPLVLAVVGTLVLLGMGWWALRRRPVVPLPPDRVALRELDRLARQEPTTPADVERHHRELAQVLRTYLEQRYQLPAQRRTSAELTAELARAAVLTPEQQAVLGGILANCDLAKFAGLSAMPAECQAIVTRARTLVEQTAHAASAATAAPTPPSLQPR